MTCSLVKGEHPVAHARPETDDSSDSPEPTMVLCSVLPQVLVSSIAERGVSTHFAVAEFVVAGLGNVKRNRSKSGDNPLALSVAEWLHLSMSTTAPIIDFRPVKVDVCGEDTAVGRQRGRSVLSLLVGTRLLQSGNLLFWEV